MSTNSLYRQELLDHYKHPQNFGKIAAADVVKREANLHCGDVVKVYLKFAKKGPVSEWVVKQISFEGVGCAVSLAAASMVTEAVKGMRLKQLKDLNEEWVEKLMQVELTSSRLKCALLPVQSIKEAVKEIEGRR